MKARYFIECDAVIQGRRHTWFAERDCDRTNLSNTCDDIKSGQVENVSKVFRAEAGKFEDASDDVAREILHRCASDRIEPQGDLLDFLEGALGVRELADFYREAAE